MTNTLSIHGEAVTEIIEYRCEAWLDWDMVTVLDLWTVVKVRHASGEERWVSMDLLEIND